MRRRQASHNTHSVSTLTGGGGSGASGVGALAIGQNIIYHAQITRGGSFGVQLGALLLDAKVLQLYWGGDEADVRALLH